MPSIASSSRSARRPSSLTVAAFFVAAAAVLGGCIAQQNGDRCDPQAGGWPTAGSADCDFNLKCTAIDIVVTGPNGEPVSVYACCPNPDQTSEAPQGLCAIAGGDNHNTAAPTTNDDAAVGDGGVDSGDGSTGDATVSNSDASSDGASDSSADDANDDAVVSVDGSSDATGDAASDASTNG